MNNDAQRESCGDSNSAGKLWNNPITRRKFLKGTGGATLGTSFLMSGRQEAIAEEISCSAVIAGITESILQMLINIVVHTSGGMYENQAKSAIMLYLANDVGSAHNLASFLVNTLGFTGLSAGIGVHCLTEWLEAQDRPTWDEVKEGAEPPEE